MTYTCPEKHLYQAAWSPPVGMISVKLIRSIVIPSLRYRGLIPAPLLHYIELRLWVDTASVVSPRREFATDDQSSFTHSSVQPFRRGQRLHHLIDPQILLPERCQRNGPAGINFLFDDLIGFRTDNRSALAVAGKTLIT